MLQSAIDHFGHWREGPGKPSVPAEGPLVDIIIKAGEQTDKLATRALFFQDTLHLTNQLALVGGVRYMQFEQLAGMQNDMKNLLDNISVGTVFLDPGLLIRRFTREAQCIYRLVASDVGRPLSDIKADIDSELVLADARTVIATLNPCERELPTCRPSKSACP